MRWVSGSHPVTPNELKDTAAVALSDYLVSVVPLHVAHKLIVSDVADRLMGEDLTGKITLDEVTERLTWLSDGFLALTRTSPWHPAWRFGSSSNTPR